MDVPKITHMGRQRGLVAGIALVMTAAIIGLGIVQADSNGKSRRQLVRVFDRREQIGAALFESLLRGTMAPTQLPTQLSGRTVTKKDLLAADGTQTLSDAVYTLTGTQLVGTITRGAVPISGSTVQQLIVNGSHNAGVSLSNILGGGRTTALAIATIFPTHFGPRIHVTQFPLLYISQLLPSYMSTMNDRGGEAFIIDAANRVIGTSTKHAAAGAVAPDESLLDAVPGHPTGAFSHAGTPWHFTAGTLAGTDWKLVLAVPDSVLFAPVSGAGQVVPWLLIGLLSLTCLAVVLLVRGARRNAERLAVANAELEQRNAAVEEANQAKSRFLAGMSHELRTPLNGIIGFAELMYDGKVGTLSETHQDFMGDILASGRHLLALINDVLDISKIEAGKLEFDRKSVAIAPLVAEILGSVRPLADAKRITVRTEIAPDLDVVWLDPARFRQVLLNYASNAIKFTGDGGNVWIRLSAGTDNLLRLEVEDDGIGIAPENLDLLFSEFAQLRGNGESPPGTGLGLALTKRLVEAQGGCVSVRSQPGSGSVFAATLVTAAETA